MKIAFDSLVFLFFLDNQALDVDPATGLLEGDDDDEGYEEEYPLEQLNIATADFMAKVSGDGVGDALCWLWCFFPC